MPFTYNDVPVANQTVASSQGPIRVNFQSIQSLIDVNHYDFNNALAGKHFQVEMPNQTSNPAGASNEMTLFSKQYNNGVTTQSEAFVVRDVTGVVAPNIPIPFTAGVGNSANNGWCFLPAGMILKWGQPQFNSPFTNPQTITPIGPVMTQIYSVNVNIYSGSSAANASQISWYITNLLANSFDVKFDLGTSGYNQIRILYFVIGAATP